MTLFSYGKEFYYRREHPLTLPEKMVQSKQRYPFNNKILHPEDKLARKPMKQWIDDINSFLKPINSQQKLMEHSEEIAIIYNQATYIMAAIGDFSNAYQFCKMAIVLFNNLFNKSKYNEHLFYCIQPWINLIRLDRMCAREPDARTKLELLIQKSKHTQCIHEQIITKTLQLNLPKNIIEVIDNAYIFEHLKIVLQQKRISRNF